ncbi:YlxR family protein [Actinocatenispora rupis]|uniref:YlxR family protein n=1 Tax=Actinocatenispora rupis TaxID=519421 RepID=UPI001942B524|nr:YlxR family protein [Actinocatenispora rupis]
MVRRTSPVRTCVGCRQRAPAAALLRVVAIRNEAGLRLVPDPARTLPGRGAHLHQDPACLALAERRRAFGRALRLDAGSPVDPTPVREYVGARSGGNSRRHGTQGPGPNELGRSTDMSAR